MSKQPELKKSEYMKDKEKQAADKAAEERAAVRRKEKKDSKRPLKETLRSQRFRHGTVASIITALGLVVLVLVNVVVSALGSKFPSMNVDLTSGSINSLTQSEKAAVDSVKQNTQIIIMGTKSQVQSSQQYSQVGTVAGKMAERNAKISVTYKDLDKDPTFSKQVNDDTLTTYDVVVKTAKRAYVVKSSDLFTSQSDSTTGTQQVYSQVGDALAGGLSNANSDTLTLAAFDTGHSEQLTPTSLKKLYTSNNFTAKDFNLLTDNIPAGAQLVFLGAPKTDLTDAEVKKLDSFLSDSTNGKNRGVVVSTLLLDPAKVPKLAAFLKEWGIGLENEVVLESSTSKELSNEPTYSFVDAQSDVTLNSRNSSYQNLLFPLSQKMTTATVSGVTTSALVKSSSSSYTVSAASDSSASAAGKTKAAVTVAALGQKQLTAGSKKVTASVTACSAGAFADQFIGANTYGNATWAADLAKYMTGTTGQNAVTVTPVQLNATDITLSSAASSTIGFGIFTVLIPLALFVAGGVIYTKRRKL